MADIVFGTYYTGDHVDGGTSRFDKDGIIYQGVCSGGGFNTTADAWATNQSVGWDVGVFKISFDATGVNAAIAANEIGECPPYVTQFQNFSDGSQFFWDFDNGQTSTEYEPSVSFEEPGVYNVSMIAMDTLTCNFADTVYFEIVIDPPVDVIPSFTHEVDCNDQSVTIENTTNDNTLTYTWDMGDGTILETESPIHQYDSPGTYTISLGVDATGCFEDEMITQEITILPFVIADVSSLGTEACQEAEVDFTNNSINGTTYFWDFGNGETSEEENPTHVFEGPNSFEVILTAYNPNSCNEFDTDTIEINVGPNQEIIADFEVNLLDCDSFTAEAINNSTGENVEYLWDMGDGTVLTADNVTYDYSSTGDFNITLTVLDTLCDNSDEMMIPISIVDEIEAEISEPDLSGCAPFTANFSNASIGALSCEWDLGDGSPVQAGQAVEHTYDTPGIYTVTLSVVGQSECAGIDDVTAQVEVIAPPIITPNFDIVQVGECSALEVELTNTSEGAIDSFYWDLGDGTQSTENNLTVNYQGNGTYTISLTVIENVCGAEETISHEFLISDYAEIDLGETIPLCYFEPGATLTVPVSGDDVSYLWSTNENTQSITVTEEDMYAVQVQIGDCLVSDSVEVVVTDELVLEVYKSQCQSQNVELEIPYDIGSNYYWAATQTLGQTVQVSESGVYEFSFLDVHGCYQNGFVDLELFGNDPVVYIPNAFTPDGDGLNDVFKPVNGNLDKYEFVIFNRWGEVVFRTTDPEAFWQGEFQGGDGNEDYYVPNGVYTFIVSYSSDCNSNTIKKRGQIAVIR